MKQILGILLFVSVACSQSWEWQDPRPTGNELRDVCFVNSDVGWAVGFRQTIIHTTDGGENWIIQRETNEEYGILNCVKFVNEFEGWAAGEEVGILHTSNGGTTWEIQFNDAAYHFGCISFINADTGWVAGDVVLQTTDGGISWNQIAVMQSGIEDIHFLDSQTGVAITGSQILRTEDGGSSWSTRLTVPNGIIQLSDLHFSSETNGWVVGRYGEYLARTFNGGEQWEHYLNMYGPSLQAVFFVDSLRGWTCGNEIRHTMDCAEHWTIQIYPKNYIQSLAFVNYYTGWAVGQRGAIYHTIDEGDRWVSQKEGTYISYNDIDFVDEFTGCAVGDPQNWGDSTNITWTTDGGETWTTSEIGEFRRRSLHGVFLLNNTIGWTTGNDGIIARTTDGGNNWDLQEANTEANLFDVKFVDELRGWIIGVNGTILHTDDGGANWITQASNTNNIIFGVEFKDALRGWAAGNEGTILNTVDGGVTWTAQESGVDDDLLDVAFADSLHGWAVGEDGTILHTTDGGLNWVSQPCGTDNHLKSVVCLDSLTCRALVNDGTVLCTDDGGISWDSIAYPSNFGRGIDFVDESHGWIAGNDGILRFVPPEPYIAAVPDSLVVSYQLSENRVRLKWSQVSTDIEGNPVEVDHYLVFGSYDSDFAEETYLGIPDPPNATFFIDEVSPDQHSDYFYRVKAVVN